MGLKSFLFKKTYWGRHNELFTHGKTFTAVDRDRITSRSSYDNKIFCATLFWCSLKRSSVKLTKLLVICLNTPWKSFKVALNSFQHLYFDGSLWPLLINWCYNHGIKKLLNHWWTRCYHFLYMGFRATLNFRKFKVALNPMYRIFLNFAKSCVLSCLSNIDNFTVPFLNYKPLKL